jgi:ELWxxDGT repeat protein
MFRQTVLFTGIDATADQGLWVTNGVAAGTYELTGILNGVFFPASLTAFNGEVMFEGEDANALYGLWVTNGTAAGTTEVGVSGASTTTGLDPSEMTVFNSEVLFEGTDVSGGYGLWVTNGTTAGTAEVGGPDNGGISGAHSAGLFNYVFNPDLTVLNGEVLFEGLDASGDFGLWGSNGTAAATSELGGIGNNRVRNVSSIGLGPSYMTVFNSEVLFNGLDASDLFGLWVTNGTVVGTQEITGISNAYSHGLQPFDMTVFNGKVLFRGIDVNASYGLWFTNGTAAGTFEVLVVNASASGIFGGLQSPDFTVFNNEVLFDGTDTSGNQGLWVTNGATFYTYEFAGIAGAYSAGILAGVIPDMTVFNGEVLFNGRRERTYRTMGDQRDPGRHARAQRHRRREFARHSTFQLDGSYPHHPANRRFHWQ